MRPVRGVAVALAALALGAAALAAGCSRKGLLAPNLPPETTLFVQGPVDTVNHIVHLYWFGSDPDGFVVGYEIRFHHPDAPAETAWVPTTRGDSLFTVLTPSGYAAPTFEVRAVDDRGAVDPTPARQDFKFRNLPPVVRLVNPPGPRDTTIGTLTLSWTAQDIDGDLTKAYFLIWLDRNKANARRVGGTGYTIPSVDFAGNTQPVRACTVYVQPIDDGGLAGAPDSAIWFVRAPARARPRLLLIDGVPVANPRNFDTDTLWANSVRRCLPDSHVTIVRLEPSVPAPFRSSEDVRQTFRLFDAVFWYRGTETSFPTLLSSFQDGIEAYVDSGGKFLVEGLNLVQGLRAPGALRESWVSRRFGSDFLHKYELTVPGDSAASWGINTNRNLVTKVVTPEGTAFDNLRSRGIFGGLRGFAVRDTDYVLVWARAGQLSQQEPPNPGSLPFDVPVGVSVPQQRGGRAAIVTAPLWAMDGLRRAPAFLRQVLIQMGFVCQ